MKSGLVGKALLFDFNMKWTLEKKTYDCFVILFFVLLLYLVVSFIWLGNFSGVLFLLQCLKKWPKRSAILLDLVRRQGALRDLES